MKIICNIFSVIESALTLVKYRALFYAFKKVKLAIVVAGDQKAPFS